jgi:predicted secreted protein
MVLIAGAFETGQIIGTLVISRILVGVLELVLIKFIKVNKYVGVVISVVVAFGLYLVPLFLMSSVSSIPGTGPELAKREAETSQTNVMFFGIWVIVWLIVDIAILSLATRKSKQK